ncbi:MAG TPA: zinc ribbon domain-containing protein [Dehalococcoidia bacterium]|jgi:putative FmdB family regulatory protein|nr:zinc ribbon domain-containing protein [Dehalococcoidia bacterium]
MPLYEYLCPTCDHKFEKLQSMTSTGADCPNCEQPSKRAISVFASVTRGGASEMPTSMGPLPPLSGGGGGCCGGGCGCGS